MNSVEITNFDHGQTHPITFDVDIFSVEIDEFHIANLDRLQKYEEYTFKHYADGGPKVEVTPKNTGEFATTGRVWYDEAKLENSRIYEHEAQASSLDDLLVLFSFLTGKYVFIDEKVSFKPSNIGVEPAATSNIFKSGAISLEPLERIYRDGLATAFLNMAFMPTMGTEILGQAACVNSALNLLYEKWCSDNGYSKYSGSEYIKEALEVGKNSIRDNLSQNKFNDSAIDDIISRVRFDTAPSAVYKIGRFLEGNGLVEDAEAEYVKGNIKWINSVRNAIVHQGGVPKHNNFTKMRMVEITGATIALVRTINQWFFMKEYINVPDPIPQRDEADIIDFFRCGKFRDHAIFQKSFNEHMDELIQSWSNKNLGHPEI